MTPTDKIKLLEQYKTYNFSATKCYIISFQVDNAIKKIEAQLPPVAKKLKGIFISARCLTPSKLIGSINLNFNDGALKPCNLPVINSYNDLNNTLPFAFDEEIKPHSSVTGYYRDFGVGAMDSGLSICVYIHYTT